MEARFADQGAGDQAVEDFYGRPGAGAILSGIGWVDAQGASHGIAHQIGAGERHQRG